MNTGRGQCGLGMVEDNGNGLGGGTGRGGRMVMPCRGEHHSSNGISLKGLSFSLWVYGNNLKPGFAWSRRKSVPDV